MKNQAIKNQLLLLPKARNHKNQLGPPLKNNKLNKKKKRSMIWSSLHLILIMKNTWKIMRYDKLLQSLKSVWKKWNKTKIGRKTWLMNGMRLPKKKKLKNDKMIRLVFTLINLLPLVDPKHLKLHSRVESELKRKDNKMKSLNGISLWLLNTESNNQLRTESQIKLHLKF